MNRSAESFYAAREFLVAHREDYDTAYRDFSWPEIDEFNWALDHFDAVAADPERGAARALWIIEQDGSEAHWTYRELADRSNQVANWLRGHGVARGDRIILMLGNQFELWETLLAAMKLGAIVIPATTLLTASDLRDRLDRDGTAPRLVLLGNHGIVALGATAAEVETITTMAVKAARVRSVALSAGDLAPLDAAHGSELSARPDEAARRRLLGT